MNGLNGTPQPDRHKSLGGKPITAAGSGGAAGSSCGSHALVPDPAAWTPADAMVTSLVAAAVLAVLAWLAVAAVAWRQRGGTDG